MTTVDAFLPRFFAELAKDGRIDRAMGKARGHAHDMDCPDYWMPALFMRLSDGLIWSNANHGIEHAIEAEAKSLFSAITGRK